MCVFVHCYASGANTYALDDNKTLVDLSRYALHFRCSVSCEHPDHTMDEHEVTRLQCFIPSTIINIRLHNEQSCYVIL